MLSNEYIKALRTGVDVDWCKTPEGRRTYKSDFPSKFKKRGFDHVRIRVTEYSWVSIIQEIKAVVGDCLAANLTPILAFQGQRFKDNPCEETMVELLNWWQCAAIALKDFSDNLAFNLIIETTDGLLQNHQTLNEFYRRCVPELRRINSDRVIIVCPCRISAPERLPLLEVPEGCAVESHFYASGQSRTNPNKLWTTGTEEEKQLLFAKCLAISEWRQKTGIEVWVGAIMFSDYNSDDDGDILTSSYTVEEQVVFAQFVKRTLNYFNIPFAANSDTKFFDRAIGEWRKEQEPVVDVLVG